MRPIATLDDTAPYSEKTDRLEFHRDRLLWLPLAEAAPPKRPLPLLDESVRLVDGWLARWHRGEDANAPAPAVGCYLAGDAIVAERGMIFFRDRLITAPTLLPSYVRRALRLETGGSTEFRHAVTRPIRTIEEPCVVFNGHGFRVYGHFLLESLPRLLAALRAARQLDIGPKFLLDRRTPGWARAILRDHLGVADGRIIEHQADVERVLLRRAILPTFAYTDCGLHPYAEALFGDLEDRLPVGRCADIERIFLSRFLFDGRSSIERHCTNEADLLRIAAREYGFTPIFPETLPWRTQVSLFRGAKVIAGLFGSGLHNTVFAGADARIGAVGWLNLVQSHLAAFRGHRMAYVRTIPARERIHQVDPDDFRAFLRVLTS